MDEDDARNSARQGQDASCIINIAAKVSEQTDVSNVRLKAQRSPLWVSFRSFPLAASRPSKLRHGVVQDRDSGITIRPKTAHLICWGHGIVLSKDVVF